MTDTFFRQANMADFSALESLQAAAFRELGGADYTAQQLEAALAHVNLLTPAIVAEGHYFVLQDRYGGIVASGGWSQLTPGYEAALKGQHQVPTKNAAIIRSMYVSPEHARQGLGSTMLRIVEADAKAAGISSLSLTATLTGIPLYKKFGYRSDRWTYARLPDGSSFTLLEMTKQLVHSQQQAA